MPISVFLTGATGLIGASVLQIIAKNPKYDVTVLVRSAEKAKKISEVLGVKTVVGSLDDAELLTKAGTNSDAILQIAAFHLEGTNALLAGAKKRFEATGKAPIYIHTSGTGIWAELSNGAAPSAKVTKDTDSDLVATYNSFPHTPSAKAVQEAATAGYVKTFSVYPSTVWGKPTGPLFESGIAHVGSIQVPKAIKRSIDRGQGGVVGEGLNLWNHVHIADTTDFYVTLLAKAVDGSAPSGAVDGHYILENGTYQYLKLAQIYTQALHAKGKSASPEPTLFVKEDFDAEPFLFALGTNSTTASPRARALGWEPKYTTDDFYNEVLKEVDNVIAGKTGA